MSSSEALLESRQIEYNRILADPLLVHTSMICIIKLKPCIVGAEKFFCVGMVAVPQTANILQENLWEGLS